MYDKCLAGPRESVRCLTSNLETNGGRPPKGRVLAGGDGLPRSGLLESTAEAVSPGVPCFIAPTGSTGAHGHPEREGHAGTEASSMIGRVVTDSSTPTISRLVSNYGHAGRVL